jgi:hypothetical protein
MGDLDAAGGDGDLEDGGDGDLEDGSDSEMDVDEADAAAYELCEASQDARDLAKASAASAAALEALEELDASGGKIRRRKGKMWGAYASAARRGAYEQSVSSCLFVRGGDEYQYMTQPLIGYVLFLAERLESAPVAAAATEGPTLASLVQRSLDVQSEVDEEEEGHPPRANLGSRDFPLNLAKAAALDEADATPGARHALMQAASEKLRSCADELLKFQTFLNEQQQKQFAAWASGNDDDASYNGPRVTWWETKTLTVLPPPFATKVDQFLHGAPQLAHQRQAVCSEHGRLLGRARARRRGLGGLPVARLLPELLPLALREAPAALRDGAALAAVEKHPRGCEEQPPRARQVGGARLAWEDASDSI